MGSKEISKKITSLEHHLLDQLESRSVAEGFFWHRLRSHFTLSQFRKWIAPELGGITILDIGAGAGVFRTHLLHDAPGANYVFIEPLESLAKNITTRSSINADWSKRSNFQGARGAVLLDVLEHQENDLIFLKDLYAKFDNEAILVITCPAFHFLWSAWDVQLGHYRRYTLSQLQKVVREGGFEVLQSRYLFQSMVLPALIRKRRPAQGTEFPALKSWVNELIYQLGRVELKLGRWMPFGSSVVVVCQKIVR